MRFRAPFPRTAALCAGPLTLLPFFYAPFAYGATTPNTILWLCLLLLPAIIVGLLGWMPRWAPASSWPPRLFLLALVAQGAWMILNAESFFIHSDQIFVYLRNPFPLAPGSWERTASAQEMMQISSLLLFFWWLLALAQDRFWRKNLLGALAATGAIISLIGIILKLGGRPLGQYFWEPYDLTQSNFAFYRYHGNAGALLNMTWPLAAGFTLRAFEKSASSFAKAGWLIATLISFLGLLINFSKASLIIGFALAFAFFLFKGNSLYQYAIAKTLPVHRKWYAIFLALILLSLAAFVGAAGIGFGTAWTRWGRFDQEKKESVENRLLSYQVTWKAARQAGFFGFGPGTFQYIFPLHLKELPQPLRGRWIYAHEDYLQTVVEWGWVGAFLWSCLTFGGLLRGWYFWSRREFFDSSGDRLMLLAVCLALTGTLIHAGFDFPLQIASLRLYFLTLLAICWSLPWRRRRR